MQNLLSQTKLTIGDTFERAGEVLRQHGMDDKGFVLQLCAYRNYNVPVEQVLEHSAYDNRPQVLRDFLSRISIAGGLGSEALELALWHAANEIEAARCAGEEADTQVIFVGDAPAQEMSEVLMKRGDVSSGFGGEFYWAQSCFGAPTEWRVQLKRLIALCIPVHAFWLAPRARSQFEEMSRLSAGSCHPLDVSSPASASRLTDLLTMAVLKSVGGARTPSRSKRRIHTGSVTLFSASSCISIDTLHTRTHTSCRPHYRSHMMRTLELVLYFDIRRSDTRLPNAVSGRIRGCTCISHLNTGRGLTEDAGGGRSDGWFKSRWGEVPICTSDRTEGEEREERGEARRENANSAFLSPRQALSCTRRQQQTSALHAAGSQVRW
jgi:hypothetical protein